MLRSGGSGPVYSVPCVSPVLVHARRAVCAKLRWIVQLVDKHQCVVCSSTAVLVQAHAFGALACAMCGSVLSLGGLVRL